ncbi:MAG TPA: hypothetical protein VKC66_21595 [Xanthobacteraceae bacterium]|nr:hypothetical protein [Xanthobacteraceae bacterium]
MKALLVAWFASALAFSGAMLCWMFLTTWIEGAVPTRPLGIVRGGLFALILGLIFQFGYGGVAYVILTRTGLWNIWTVSLAYLLPVFYSAIMPVTLHRTFWGPFRGWCSR